MQRKFRPSDCLLHCTCCTRLQSSHSKKEKDLEMRERIAHQQLQSCKEQLQLSEAKAKELQLSCAAEMRTAKSENEAKLQEYRERILKVCASGRINSLKK